MFSIKWLYLYGSKCSGLFDNGFQVILVFYSELFSIFIEEFFIDKKNAISKFLNFIPNIQINGSFRFWKIDQILFENNLSIWVDLKLF